MIKTLSLGRLIQLPRLKMKKMEECMTKSGICIFHAMKKEKVLEKELRKQKEILLKEDSIRKKKLMSIFLRNMEFNERWKETLN